MKSLRSKHIFILFWLVSAVDIILVLSEKTAAYRILSKPLIIPFLTIALLMLMQPSAGKKLMTAGLLCSFAGDVLLLRDHEPAFFIAGLACFLLTHICYTIYFISLKQGQKSFLLKKPYWLLIVLLYSVSLVLLLYPGLGAMKVPVIVYAIALSAMLLTAINIFYAVHQPSAYLFIAGASLFVVSDSLLAINKFYTPLPGAGFFIMLTYCVAQFLIVLGAIRNRKTTAEE